MNSKFTTFILTLTAVTAVYLAGALIFFWPDPEGDGLASRIWEEAYKRQAKTVASVTEELETDLAVRRDDEKTAAEIAELLKKDDAFLFAVEEKAHEYIDMYLAEIEEKAAAEYARQAAEIDKSIDEKIYSLEKEIPSADDIAASLLSDEAFIAELLSDIKTTLNEEYDSEAHAEDVIASEAFQKALEEYKEENTPVYTAVPLPSIDPSSAEKTMSESEYMEERNARRREETAAVLSLLGY